MALLWLGEIGIGLGVLGLFVAYIVVKRVVRGALVVVGWFVEARRGLREAFEQTRHLRR